MPCAENCPMMNIRRALKMRRRGLTLRISTRLMSRSLGCSISVRKKWSLLSGAKIILLKWSLPIWNARWLSGSPIWMLWKLCRPKEIAVREATTPKMKTSSTLSFLVLPRKSSPTSQTCSASKTYRTKVTSSKTRRKSPCSKRPSANSQDSRASTRKLTIWGSSLKDLKSNSTRRNATPLWSLATSLRVRKLARLCPEWWSKIWRTPSKSIPSKASFGAPTASPWTARFSSNREHKGTFSSFSKTKLFRKNSPVTWIGDVLWELVRCSLPTPWWGICSSTTPSSATRARSSLRSLASPSPSSWSRSQNTRTNTRFI